MISPLDNANPGTLRWALLQCASNGVSEPDTIVFNIPSTLPAARVIQLTSELPFITSNIVIDATTQAGLPWGPDAKIVITPTNFQNCKRGFVIRDASNIEIYGFLIAGFISSNPVVAERFSDGIFMWNVDNVTIGKIGKGNSFTGDFNAIRHEAIPERDGDPPPPGSGNHIQVQANTIGQNQTGRPLPMVGVVNGVGLFNCSNVLVGGQFDEINKFMVFLSAVRISLRAGNISDSSFIQVLGNTFDPGTSVPALPVVLPILGIEVVETELASPGFHVVTISNNSIQKYTTGITLFKLKHPFLIAHNTIDLDRTRNLFPSSLGIGIAGCDSGLIGGSNNENLIHDIKNYGLSISASKFITMSQNQVYCTPKGIFITAPAIPIPVISSLVINPALSASGKTCINCKIEVFNTDECSSEIYNGKFFEAGIIADNLGNWSYSGTLTCNTSFTTTSTSGTTSAYYTPYEFILDTTLILVTPASCGRNNGAIRGAKIYAGVDFHWEDILGNIVGTDTNLINIGAGFYRLVGVKQNLGCVLTSSFYEVKNIQPVIDLSELLLTQPSDCGGLGSIRNIHVLGGPLNLFSYKWRNGLGIVVGSALDLLNVGPGSYRLRVSMISDTTCFAVAGVFNLVNQPAPTIDSSNVLVTGATCGNANGSISGIVINNVVGNQLFIWKNLSGAIVGYAPTLTNVPAGKYRLIYKDDAPCDTLRTGYYLITNTGKIIINEFNKVITPSGCRVNNGSIRNISVIGANSYSWIRVSDQVIVGNSADLFNIGSGDYRLRVYDTQHGCLDSTTIIHVPNAAMSPLTIGNITKSEETCSGSNGSIILSGISPTSGFNYKWVKNSTDTFSTVINITHLTAGDYTLIAYDANGCNQIVVHQVLINHASPVLALSKTISNDTCGQGHGSISNLLYSGGEGPFSYKWFNSSNQIISSQKDLRNVPAGNYYFIVTDLNGCSDSTSMINIRDIQPDINAPVYDDAYVKRNTSYKLVVKNPRSGIYHMFEDPVNQVQYAQNTTGNFTTPVLQTDKDYYMNLQVGACFSQTTKVHIYVIDNARIFAPNSFTPNGDNLNDVFSIKVFGKITIDYFEIYNRWGQLVFRTKDISRGWNGYTGNSLSPAGAYVWIMQGYDIDGSVLTRKGSVLLIR